MSHAPRLGPTLDLLIRDVEHPRALAFQWQAIARDMQRLAETLQLEAGDAVTEPIPALTDSQLMVLEGDGPAAAAARLHLAARLQQLAIAAGQFSDRLVDAAFLAHQPAIRRRWPHERARSSTTSPTKRGTCTRAKSCIRTSCCIWCRRPAPYQQCLEHELQISPGSHPSAR